MIMMQRSITIFQKQLPSFWHHSTSCTPAVAKLRRFFSSNAVSVVLEEEEDCPQQQEQPQLQQQHQQQQHQHHDFSNSPPQKHHHHPCNGFRIHNSLSQGLVDYRTSWAWQHLLLSRRLSARRQQQQQQQADNMGAPSLTAAPDDDDLVLLFEHHPVYTLGRGADENHLMFLNEKCNANNNNKNNNDDDDDNDDDHIRLVESQRAALSRKNRGGARLTVDRRQEQALLALPDEMAVEQLASTTASPVVLAPNGSPIYRVERGGEVTYHGPGQLVVYPLVDLKREPFVADLHWFLRQVEDVIIATLREYDIHGVRDEINTGVWVDQAKIAAVGVAASRWITTHGFALNVHPNLEYFDTSIIMPCGIPDRGVTSLEAILRARGAESSEIPTVAQVAEVVLQKMKDVFGVSRFSEA